MKEIWKPIPGYEGLYAVSNIGRVRRACKGYHYKKGNILPFELCKGYPRIKLHKNGSQKFHKIHQLVLKAFRGHCPEGKEASHLNDVKTNNHLKNLAWMTHSENCKLAIKNSRTTKGRISPMKGKHHSEETKRKISEANKNKKRSPKQIKHYIQAWKIKKEKHYV